MHEAISSLTDYAFHVSPVEWRSSLPDESTNVIRMGVTSFKVYWPIKILLGLMTMISLKVMKVVGKEGGTVTETVKRR
jgi:hypothetical protein